MSISLFPQLYFRGGMPWDPGLGNNFSVFDPIQVKVNLPGGMTLPELKQQLPVALAAQGNWNHFGTHRAVFEGVEVTGVATTPNSVNTTDSLVGKPLSMDGKLVDLNAATDHGTQVFFDELRLGNLLGGFTARRRRRMYMRFLNFERNQTVGGPRGAGAVWEVCFAKDDVGLANTAGSAFLQQIETAFDQQDIQGLAVRFHTYRTLYYQNGERNTIPQTPRDGEELADLYRTGANFSNPAYSLIVGVITLWRETDFEGHPGGRFLLPSGERDPLTGVANGFGPTSIEIDDDRKWIYVDLGQTVMENNPTDVEKVNHGDLTIRVEAAGQTHDVATITYNKYDKRAYETSAGVLGIDLTGLAPEVWNELGQGNLSLHSADSQPSSLESEFVVAVEQRDVYLDQEDDFSLELFVLQRGKPAPAGTRIQAALYEQGTNPQPVLVGVVATLTVDGDGRATFDVTADHSSMKTFVFQAYRPADPEPVPADSFSFPLRSTAFHCNVRVLPFDDQLNTSTPDSSLTWNWLYENVLAAYDVINPVMARQSRPNINAPLDNQQRMEALAGRIKRLVDKGRLEEAGYMPVTRDLSNGKRALITRWCDLVLAGNQPSDSIPFRDLGFTSTDRRVDVSDKSVSERK